MSTSSEQHITHTSRSFLTARITKTELAVKALHALHIHIMVSIDSSHTRVDAPMGRVTPLIDIDASDGPICAFHFHPDGPLSRYLDHRLRAVSDDLLSAMLSSPHTPAGQEDLAENHLFPLVSFVEALQTVLDVETSPGNS